MFVDPLIYCRISLWQKIAKKVFTQVKRTAEGTDGWMDRRSFRDMFLA